jgi:hypothetical protein
MENQFEILKNPGANNATASIHQTGRTGFSTDANKLMKLSGDKYIRIARKKNEEEKDNLYLFVDSEETEGSFKIIKAGKYFYLNTTPLFDELKYNYKEVKYTYKIRKYDKEKEIYLLTRYYLDNIKRKNKKDENKNG